MINNENYQQVSHVFNFLSSRMHSLKGKNSEPCFQMTGNLSLIPTKDERQLVFEAMTNASDLIEDPKAQIDFIKQGAPWIKFVALNYSEPELSEGIRSFLCGNGELRRNTRNAKDKRSYEEGDVILEVTFASIW